MGLPGDGRALVNGSKLHATCNRNTTFAKRSELHPPEALRHLRAQSKTPSTEVLGVCCCKSLTMSYFHTGIRTIIGAEAFHCPVRDGKEWYHLAMVIRHNFLLA
jgi:hypothetical protein